MWYFLSLLLLGEKIKTAFDNRNFIEEREIEKGFTDFYQKELQPLVIKRENLRVESLELCIKLSRIVGVFLVLIWSVFLYFFHEIKALDSIIIYDDKSVYDLIFVIFFFANFSIFIPNIPCSNYKNAAKKDLFAKIFRFFLSS